MGGMFQRAQQAGGASAPEGANAADPLTSLYSFFTESLLSFCDPHNDLSFASRPLDNETNTDVNVGLRFVTVFRYGRILPGLELEPHFYVHAEALQRAAKESSRCVEASAAVDSGSEGGVDSVESESDDGNEKTLPLPIYELPEQMVRFDLPGPNLTLVLPLDSLVPTVVSRLPRVVTHSFSDETAEEATYFPDDVLLLILEFLAPPISRSVLSQLRGSTPFRNRERRQNAAAAAAEVSSGAASELVCAEWNQWLWCQFVRLSGVCRRWYRLVSHPSLYHYDGVPYETPMSGMQIVGNQAIDEEGGRSATRSVKKSSEALPEVAIGEVEWAPLKSVICGVERVLFGPVSGDAEADMASLAAFKKAVAAQIRSRFLSDDALKMYLNRQYWRGHRLSPDTQRALLRFVLHFVDDELPEDEENFAEFAPCTEEDREEILRELHQCHLWETCLRFGISQNADKRRYLRVPSLMTTPYDRSAAQPLAHGDHLYRRLSWLKEKEDRFVLVSRGRGGGRRGRNGRRRANEGTTAGNMLSLLDLARGESRPSATEDDEDSLVAQWVFDLRTMNGSVSMPGAAVDLRRDYRAGDSPYSKLLALGETKIIPLAIEHWDDSVLSRSLQTSNMGGRFPFGSHGVLTVGDCFRRLVRSVTGMRMEKKGEVEEYWVQLRSAGSEEERMAILQKQILSSSSFEGLRQYFEAYKAKDMLSCIELLETIFERGPESLGYHAPGFQFLQEDCDLRDPRVRRMLLRSVTIRDMKQGICLVLTGKDDIAPLVEFTKRKFLDRRDSWGDLAPVEFWVLALAGELDYLEDAFREQRIPLESAVKCVGELDRQWGLKWLPAMCEKTALEQQERLQPFIQKILSICLTDFRRSHSSGGASCSTGSYDWAHVRVCDYAALVIDEEKFPQSSFALSEKHRDHLIHTKILEDSDFIVRKPDVVVLTQDRTRSLSDRNFESLRRLGASAVAMTLEFLRSHSYVDESLYKLFLTEQSFVVFSVVVDGSAMENLPDVIGEQLSHDVIDALLSSVDSVWGFRIDRDPGDSGVEILMTTRPRDELVGKGKELRWRVEGERWNNFDATAGSMGAQNSLAGLFRERVPIEELKLRAGWLRGFEANASHEKETCRPEVVFDADADWEAIVSDVAVD